MKNFLYIIILLSIAFNAHSNTTLPWDSLFSSYGLTHSMSMIPTYISPNLNINYTDEYSVGIWRLTPPVARQYGLIVNNNIDQRYDLKLSSEAAARYLKDLMTYYDNEKITILAYLNGAALLVEIAKTHNINLHNPTDTDIEILCNNVPKNNIYDSIQFINFNYLDSLYNHTGHIKYTSTYPIRKQTIQDSLFHNTENFYLHNSTILPNTRWIKEVFIPENIDNINEWFASIYQSEQEALLAEQTEINKQKESEKKARIAAIKKANDVKIYHVKSGDTLGHIAKRHHVSVRQIKQWNNLKSDMIRIGQKLKIHTN